MIVYALRDSYTERLHSQPQLSFSFRELARTIYNAFTDDKGDLLPKKSYEYLQVVYLTFIDDFGNKGEVPLDFPNDETIIFDTDKSTQYSPVSLLIEYHKSFNKLV